MLDSENHCDIENWPYKTAFTNHEMNSIPIQNRGDCIKFTTY